MAPKKHVPIQIEAEVIEPTPQPQKSVTTKRNGNGRVETISRKHPAVNSLIEWANTSPVNQEEG